MNKYSRLMNRAEKRKRKGKNASKLLDKAKSFLNDANVQKSMSKTYNSLTKYEKKRINNGYISIQHRMFRTINDYYTRRAEENNRISIGTRSQAYNVGRMMADNYLKGELLSRKK